MHIKFNEKLSDELKGSDFLHDVEEAPLYDLIDVIEKISKRFVKKQMTVIEDNFARIIGREMEDLYLSFYGDGSLHLVFAENYAIVGQFNIFELLKEEIESNDEDDKTFLDECMITFKKLIEIVEEEKSRRSLK